MSGKINSFPKAFSVSFSEINRWDPNSFHGIRWHWSPDVMCPINKVLQKTSQKVDREQHSFDTLMPITIHFDGTVEPREIDEDREYSMDLFWAPPGSIVVSKIDLKNGAVAVIPDHWNNAVVTGHFAVYRPDSSKINSKYFHLLIQADFFKNYLWRNKVGAEGRKEVKLPFFEAIEIPVPLIDIQEAIVEQWNEAKRAYFSASERLSDAVKLLDQELIQRTNRYHEATTSRVLAVRSVDIAQWDLHAGRAAAFIEANPHFARMGEYIEECTEQVKPWLSPKVEWPVYGVNNKARVFLNGRKLGSQFNAAYKRIEKNWFFHNPTRANVGSLGMVPEVEKNAITSPEYQVWRIRQGLDVNFVALMLQTSYFLKLVGFNRVGGVKQRMYYSNLAEIRIPKFSLSEQRGFAEHRSAAIAAIDEANLLLKSRKQEVDQMILGKIAVGIA